MGSTRYSTLPDPSTPLPRVHPSPTMPAVSMTSVQPRAVSGQLNIAVGLISVDQLSLYASISDIRGMTEVYNLSDIGRINNHSFIVGNK